ncbi:MAG: flagellar hook-associated protein FlgK, partial [Thermotogota bacterium]|nr:flagellar hook-associated protein FlgK [Thermotogota bacterium]
MSDMSIFSILNTGVLGTYTAKLAMSVTAHNISNTNTPGYSRQRPMIVSTAPMAYSSLSQSNANLTLGTGSMVKRVERVRDQFLDTQFRVIKENHSFWDNMSSNLHYMEQLLNEPAENGFRGYFDKMWFSFQEVMSNPTNEASIQSVKSEVNNFVSTFQDLYGRFEELRSNLNNDIKDTVNQINTITAQIGNVNSQIRQSLIAGSEPNDILDERDKLLDELNKYANTTVKKGEMGHLEIYIGQQVVVHGDHVTEIKATVRPETLNTYDLFVRSTKIDVQKGKLGAMLELRDQTIPAYLDKYDEMALMMADKLNLIHQAGYDKSGKISGINLFKEMEQLRSTLPNVFRMSGTNPILNGPIHMATSEISTNPSGTSLGLSGNISFVDLNNYLFDKAISTDTFATNKKFEEVIESLNDLGLYSTFAKNLTVDDANSVISLDDFATYDGDASIFYRTTEEYTSADDGIIKITDLIDIDGDGQYLSQDIEIFDDGGNQYEDFTYEISTGVLTVQDLPDTFNGNLIVNRWKQEEILVEDGGIGFSGITNKFKLNEKEIDAYYGGINTLEIVDNTYNGPGELYYILEEDVTADFTSGEGKIVVDGKFIDINNDGHIDLDDLRIQADGAVDIENYTVEYDAENNETTITSD